MGQAVMMAVSVGSSLMAAKTQRDAYELEAEANEQNAELAGIEMEQQENASRNDLINIISSLNVGEASRGVSVKTGGSSGALRMSEQKMADSDLSSIRLMGLSKARQFRLGSKQARLSGTASMLGGASSSALTYRRYKIDKGDWGLKG